MSVPTQGKLVVMSPTNITQNELSTLLSKRSRIRHGLAELRDTASELFARIESGAEITDGALDLEIRATCKHGKVIRQLLLDGRPIDDVNGE